MKKLCALILALILCSSAALAEGIDLSGMSFDELLELQRQVTQALWASDEWVSASVPTGLYEVGVDIPAGHWTVDAGDDYLLIKIYRSLKSASAGDDWIDAFTAEPGLTTSLYCAEGQALQVVYGPAHFSHFVADFGFTK